jgi:hypothetical protein
VAMITQRPTIGSLRSSGMGGVYIRADRLDGTG